MIVLAKLFLLSVTYQTAGPDGAGVWTYYETYQYPPDPTPLGFRDCGLTFVSPQILAILMPECL